MFTLVMGRERGDLLTCVHLIGENKEGKNDGPEKIIFWHTFKHEKPAQLNAVPKLSTFQLI